MNGDIHCSVSAVVCDYTIEISHDMLETGGTDCSMDNTSNSWELANASLNSGGAKLTTRRQVTTACMCQGWLALLSTDQVLLQISIVQKAYSSVQTFLISEESTYFSVLVMDDFKSFDVLLWSDQLTCIWHAVFWPCTGTWLVCDHDKGICAKFLKLWVYL